MPKRSQPRTGITVVPVSIKRAKTMIRILRPLSLNPCRCPENAQTVIPAWGWGLGAERRRIEGNPRPRSWPENAENNAPVRATSAKCGLRQSSPAPFSMRDLRQTIRIKRPRRIRERSTPWDNDPNPDVTERYSLITSASLGKQENKRGGGG